MQKYTGFHVRFGTIFQNLVTFCISIVGYSGADVASVCSEAAMGPIRNISIDEIKHIASDKVSE